ncbi:MAG TPA: hypothetical protein PLR83_07775 [Pyrinomonadaceae bacterium]|nr:hypothetical protein [Pyrinomonadaceae bacterium]
MFSEDQIISELPDADAARRFRDALPPKIAARLRRDEGLYSDVLTLAAYSPLLSTTLIQNEEYFARLGRQRLTMGGRTKEELLESLGRFSLTNSTLDPQTLFSRFRRRELIRIFLRDIRRLATVAEITDEISSLADAILEAALVESRREMDKRYGQPLELDEKQRSRVAEIAAVALGKLGSLELNYASDVDLLFIYSSDGMTAGGARESITNREYFTKLAQHIIKLVGEGKGEGAAYRVDMRLRPNGSLGALSLSLKDTVEYYKKAARPWERQMLIRSRISAGDPHVFREFWDSASPLIYDAKTNVANALAGVRASKESIDEIAKRKNVLDVKLSPGGIREIEFIAQALQLAHGGRDKWLRSPHTLIALSRLADRELISPVERAELSKAYDLLRRTEHILQMENGLQTHAIPTDAAKRELLAKRVQFATGANIEKDLERSMKKVRKIYERVFTSDAPIESPRNAPGTLSPNERSEPPASNLAAISPPFAAVLANAPKLAERVEQYRDSIETLDLRAKIFDALAEAKDFRSRLDVLRHEWTTIYTAIGLADLFEEISVDRSKALQTILAEVSLDAAMHVVRQEIKEGNPTIAVLALGKLGGQRLDFGSDLDIILSYTADPAAKPETQQEYFSRAAELFINSLSSMTRAGSLYRVDLRLRPFGSKGLSIISSSAFIDYLRTKAAVWELLAFVKARGITNGSHLDVAGARELEAQIREIVYSRAAATPSDELRESTLSVREALRQRKATARSGIVDIKYGEGGMLDIYFAMRFLQLRDGVLDDAKDRSTPNTLNRLLDSGSISVENFDVLLNGHKFLSTVDHAIRLCVGRSTRLPVADSSAMERIIDRLKFPSTGRVLEELTIHRLAIREAYEAILR